MFLFFACAFMCVCVCVYLFAFEQLSLPLCTCHFSACIGSELSSVAIRFYRLRDHLQVCAIDVGAWYITYFVAVESPEDAFTVRAHEVFVDVLVELA